MKKLILLLTILATTASANQLMKVAPVHHTEAFTYFSTNHVTIKKDIPGIFSGDEVRKLSYEEYIKERSGCNLFKVVGISESHTTPFTIMIDCMD